MHKPQDAFGIESSTCAQDSHPASIVQTSLCHILNSRNKNAQIACGGLSPKIYGYHF